MRRLNMLNKFIILLKKYRKFIIYGFIGVTGVTLDLIIFSALIKFSPIYYLLANIVSVSLGIINNFVLNVLFNFKVKNNLFRRFLNFYGVGMVGLLVSSIMLFILVSFFGLNVYLSKSIIILLVVVLQYNLNVRYSFKN